MPSAQEPAVPARLLRTDTAYRTLAPGREMRIGAGFILKSGRAIDHPWHATGGYSAVWCLRGSGDYRDHDGRIHPVRTGSLLHRFHDRFHENRIDPGCHWAEAWIVVPNQIADGLLAASALDLRRPVQHPGIDLGLVEELSGAVELVRNAPESGLPRILAELIRLLMVLTTRDAGHDDEEPQRRLVDRACRRLSEAHRLDLAELAAEVGLSYERFRKVFREQMGVSPGEYRIRRRIDRARALLLQGQLPIKGIAEELGYPNPYAFSAQFKQAVGESPESYRKRH
jgi:AraC-like DNA-binding protein